GEEDGVVARHVLGIIAGRIEEGAAHALHVTGERIHLGPVLGPEGDLAEPDAILREGVAGVTRVGLFDPEATAGADPADARFVVPHRWIAEARDERGVERSRAQQVVDAQDDVVDAVDRGIRRSGRRAAAAGRGRHELVGLGPRRRRRRRRLPGAAGATWVVADGVWCGAPWCAAP